MSFGFILLIVLMLSVAVVLFTGIAAMLVGGEFNEKYGNKLMRLRVVLQGLAIGVLLLLAMCQGK
ncbi:MAG: twin transmembrane helix small protein [Alphaproteobacteria bacterium]|nr:twin transmembrane helix small protein [Alphaproteobacteria bacterium]